MTGQPHAAEQIMVPLQRPGTHGVAACDLTSSHHTGALSIRLLRTCGKGWSSLINKRSISNKSTVSCDLTGRK